MTRMKGMTRVKKRKMTTEIATPRLGTIFILIRVDFGFRKLRLHGVLGNRQQLF